MGAERAPVAGGHRADVLQQLHALHGNPARGEPGWGNPIRLTDIAKPGGLWPPGFNLRRRQAA